ncbi:glycosyltransferase [Paenibacillus caui]|uniref:glycosyltransferase n=1 Tax=Paenibacillus caui TaxID=2873927 RepID=UPI001CA8CCBF|nr:glycosyltransferase [Paenibacillus caui]
MKIAYLIHWNEGAESGVFKKVVHQMTEWRRFGHEAALFLFTCKPAGDWANAAEGIETNVQIYSSASRRMADFGKLARKVRAWQPDVIYHRFDLYYVPLPRLLREIPSVLEINSNDLAELRMEKRLRYYYHVFTRGKVLAAAKGHVYVSGELAATGHYRRYAKNRAIIGNGIRLDDFPGSEVRPPSSAGGSSPRLVFIGSPGQPWHGADLIAELARLKPEWSFDLIGLSAEELEQPAPGNMTFHGKMKRSEYQPLLERADVAIGTLALYRKEMKEASPLKVREYLANGLPVIIAYEETDFADEVPFMLKLPLGPWNIRDHLAAIERFVAQWQGKRVCREAVRHLDTACKEEARLAFMKRMMEKGEEA